MPSYKIKHITRYRYASTVIDCTNQIMLYPIVDAQLEVRRHEIQISHYPAVETFIDYFGNQTGVFSVIKPHTELLIESIAEVITKPVIFPLDDINPVEQWGVLNRAKNDIAHLDYLKQESFASSSDVKKVLSEIITHEKSPLQNAVALSEYVYNNFSYQKGLTSVETKTEEVWLLKAGVCQDFAHILLVFFENVLYSCPVC